MRVAGASPPPFLQVEHPEKSASAAATMLRGGVARRRAFTQLIAFTLSCTTLLATIGGGRRARANGRFPQAQAIESVPGSDGTKLFVRATFGVLVSRDAGASWRWICERALGYEGQWDPPIAVTKDGRLWVGLERGLVSTDDDGCSVQASSELDGEQIKDLTVDPNGEVVWAITGAPDRRGAVWRRASDRDARWERVGLVQEDVNPMTIEVAPSRPGRIYVTGQPYGTIRGRLYTSEDGGRTLRGDDNALPDSGPLFIAAVDAKDDRRVVLRQLHTTGSELLVTKDAGKTFASVLSMKSGMLGFARSADGRTYWAASGLAEHGLHRSTDRGDHFERMSDHGVMCLHAAPGGRLFACENPFTLGAPALALSTDEGKTLRAIARFTDIGGPVACDAAAADAAASICGALWTGTRDAFSPRPSASVASRPRDGGDGAGDASRPPPTRRACGCATVGGPDRDVDRRGTLVGLLALGVWSRARRLPRPRSDRVGTA